MPEFAEVATRCSYHILSINGHIVTLDMAGQIQLLVVGMREYGLRTGLAPVTCIFDDGKQRWMLEVWPGEVRLERVRGREPARYVGIYPRDHRWCALISLDGQQHYGGLFPTQIEAAWAHDELALRLLSQGAKPRYRLKLNYLRRLT